MSETFRSISTLSSIRGLLRAQHILLLRNDYQLDDVNKRLIQKMRFGSITDYYLSEVLQIAQERTITPEKVFADNLPLILRHEDDIPIFFLNVEEVGMPLCLIFLKALTEIQPSVSAKTHGAIVVAPDSFHAAIPEFTEQIAVYS